MLNGKTPADKGWSGIFQNIPRDLMKKVKTAASVEGKSNTSLLIEASETCLQELDNKGLLLKGKN